MSKTKVELNGKNILVQGCPRVSGEWRKVLYGWFRSEEYPV